MIYGLVLVVLLTKFCANSEGPLTILGKNGWIRKGGSKNEGLPEPNPVLDNAINRMNRRHDELRARFGRLESVVSNLQRGVPVSFAE